MGEVARVVAVSVGDQEAQEAQEEQRQEEAVGMWAAWVRSLGCALAG